MLLKWAEIDLKTKIKDIYVFGWSIRIKVVEHAILNHVIFYILSTLKYCK